jgi:hypothetical protein
LTKVPAGVVQAAAKDQLGRVSMLLWDARDGSRY